MSYLTVLKPGDVGQSHTTMAKYSPIFLVRHGDYESATGKLSELGKQQYVSLAKEIDKTLKASMWEMNELGLDPKELEIHFLSSSAPRAVESAKILQRELKIQDPVVIQFLHTDEEHLYTPAKRDALKKKVQAFLKSEKPGYMIIVSHYEFVTYFLEDCGFIGSINHVPGTGEGILFYDSLSHGIFTAKIPNL